MTTFKLILMTLLPVFVCFVLYYLDRKTGFGKLKFKQYVIGAVFGAVAIFCTEFGIDTGFAIYNTRDASVICAGLFFGWKASAVAAVIGSVERYLAPLWGTGAYTRVACSIATFCAGIFTSFAVQHLYSSKKPNWLQGFSIGAFIEVFHMLLVFVTHSDDLQKACFVVSGCSTHMIITNSVAVSLAIITIDLYNGASLRLKLNEIENQFRYGIAILMIIAFFICISFTYQMQQKIIQSETNTLLISNIDYVENEISQMHSSVNNDNNIENNMRLSMIGKKGYVIVADSSGRIFTDINVLSDTTLNDYGMNISKGSSLVLNKCTIDGESYYYITDHFLGYIVVAVQAFSDAHLSGEINIYISIFTQMLIFALMFIILTVLVRSLVLKNINQINCDLKKITAGDLNVRLNIRQNIEFESISNEINSTVEKLEALIIEANQRLDKELALGKQIQVESLPSVFPPFPNRTDLDIYSGMQAAKQVGGDFYDFFMTNENKLYFLVGDVSGKGIPAALFMMRAKTTIRNMANTGLDVSEIFNAANNILCENNDSGMFVSAWIGCLDTDTGTVEFCNAGFNPPLFLSDNKQEFERSISGLVLAGMPGIKYKKFSRQLCKGDKIFLYTDGITEATDVNMNMFSEQRLLQIFKDLSNNDFENVKQICHTVKNKVELFTTGAEQFDDITMLCLEYKGNRSNK